jgi:hypothetical protein
VDRLDGSFGAMVSEIPERELNPPLYYMLAWAWTRPFGIGEVGLRSLSALFAAAAIPLVYLTGRRLCSHRLRSNALRPVRIAGLPRRTLEDPSALVVVERALSYEGDLAPSRSSDSATASAASARSHQRAVP